MRADAVIHAVGIAVAVVGGITLVALTSTRASLVEAAAVAIYALGFALMFVCSAVYNGLHRSPRRDLWCRLDQSAIFLMIAGTYTPFLTKLVDPAWATGLGIAVWALAAIGIAGTVALHERFNRISIGLYLALGWLVVIAIGPLASTFGTSTLALLVTGGLLYTAGVVFHVWKSLPYQNAIWHGFVLAAAAMHFAAVVDGVVLAA